MDGEAGGGGRKEKKMRDAELLVHNSTCFFLLLPSMNKVKYNYKAVQNFQIPTPFTIRVTDKPSKAE